MADAKWQKVREIFDAALCEEPEDRQAYINKACGEDKQLLNEVESLLSALDQSDRFLETPAIAQVAELVASDTKKLEKGRRFGHYEITQYIGAGGMGHVYLAQDLRLDRRVAIKILNEELSRDESNLKRFVREAKAASALNHPNIIVIHEIGESEGVHYLVSEFIEGRTLREVLTQSQMSVVEVLDVAIQIASAISAAHRAHLVHRDIKPENVMVRPDGYVKVLDFGLAKLVEQTNKSFLDLKESTVGLGQTAKGMILGTVHYMSPEQAKGEDVDERTDVFSLGAVIYEMLAGKAPFSAASLSESFANLINTEPEPLSRFAPRVPDELPRIVSKALSKGKDDRYQTMKGLLTDLRELRENLTLEGTQTKEVQKLPTTRKEYPIRKSLVWIAGVVGVLLIAVGLYYFWAKSSPPLTPLVAIPLTSDPGFEGMPSLSPDGNYVAFIAGGGEQQQDFDLYVKQIGGGPPLRLTSGPAVEEFPAWSPDGRSIAFVRTKGDKLEVLLISPLGGPERKVAEITADTSTGIFTWTGPYLSWSPDSKYLVTMDRLSPEEQHGIFLLSVITGEKRRLTTPPSGAIAEGHPAISPDGQTLALVRVVSAGSPQIYLLPLSRDYKPYGESRHLDLPQVWAVSPAWTADGQQIVYSAGQPWAAGDTRLWRVPVSGSEKPEPLTFVGENGYEPTISRQGNRLVYAIWKYDTNVWRTELNVSGKANPVKLITSTRAEFESQYSPDGSRITFVSDRSGHREIWACNSDGSTPVQLTSMEGAAGSPYWSPDGRRIVFNSNKDGQWDIYQIETDSRVSRRLTNDPRDDNTPSVSRDGKWIYFSSRRTGSAQIWRMSSDGGEAVQLTQNGGSIPIESANGEAVYYAKTLDDRTEVWQVPTTGGNETRLLGPISGSSFTVVANGIYFIEIGTPVFVGSRGNSLKFYNFATGKTERVADIQLTPLTGLSISPDGRYALMTLVDPEVCDLKLVDSFR